MANVVVLGRSMPRPLAERLARLLTSAGLRVGHATGRGSFALREDPQGRHVGPAWTDVRCVVGIPGVDDPPEGVPLVRW